MDKLNEMHTEALIMLTQTLMLFNHRKTIRECHTDINGIITKRIKAKEDLLKAKVIDFKKYKEMYGKKKGRGK